MGAIAQSKTPPAAAAVNWVTLEEALALNKKEPRKIMIDVYTKWCGPCKLMTQQTFGNPQVAEYLNTHFYSVKFDAESPDSVKFGENVFGNPEYRPNAPGRNGVHEFTQFLGVNAYPTVVFLDEYERLLMPVVGFKNPPQMELFLKLIGENHYRQITTEQQWQAWQQSFVPQWQ